MLLRRRLSSTLLVVGGFSLVTLMVPVDNARAEGFQTSWYTGLSAGSSSADYDSSDLTSDMAARGWTISNVSVDDSDTAWKVFGGVNFQEYLGAEVAYVDLGNMQADFSADLTSSQVDQFLKDASEVQGVLGRGLSAAVTARKEWTDLRWTAMGKLGVFIWEGETTVNVTSGGNTRSTTAKHDDTDLMYGIGGKVYPIKSMKNLGFRLEWERYKLTQWVDMLSIGAEYAF